MTSLTVLTGGAMLSVLLTGPTLSLPVAGDRHGELNPQVQDNCRPLEQPKKMPSMSAMLDSSEVMRRVATLDQSGLADLTVSVELDDATHLFLVDVIAPTAVHDSVRAIMLATARPRGKDFPRSYRVHFTGSPVNAVTIERSILCGPVSLGGPGGRGAVVGRVSVRASPGSGPPVAASPRSFNTRQKIDSTGQVIEVDIGSGSGFAEIDRSVRETLRDQRFIPATLDGRPVSVWVSKGKAELIR